MAHDVARALELDRLIWMTSGEPPHKTTPVAPPGMRLRMVEATIADDPAFAAWRHEIDRAGPSFTVDTLAEIAAEEPDARLWLVLGEDQYRAFDSWRDPDGILRLARLAVMDRDGRSAERNRPSAVAREGHDDRVTFVDVGRVDVSSTEVRARIGRGEDISELVPAAVAELILEAGLYTG